MKTYYVPTMYGKRELITEEYRQYVNQLYTRKINIEDVPEDKREVVQTTVENRIIRFGEYSSFLATTEDINQLVEILLAKKLTKGDIKKITSAFLLMRDKTPDDVASRTAHAFPSLREEGALIEVGTRINWNGTIKRAAVDLFDLVENNPNNAPVLWEDINYYDGYRIIPEVITVGTAFAKDELGWWKDRLYKSLIDANVYTPETYAIGWEEVIQEV